VSGRLKSEEGYRKVGLLGLGVIEDGGGGGGYEGGKRVGQDV